MDREIDRAVKVLRAGGLVGFPTETVYGLGADARNAHAIHKVFAAKGRPAGHPLIVHLPNAAALCDWALEPDERATKLAARFWPGPLTLIVPRAATVLDEVTGGQGTVGLRVPDHPIALALLEVFGGGIGGGIAAPSANRHGSVSPTRAEHVRTDLGAAVDLLLDGGACDIGIESTIVDLSSTSPGGAVRILRPGAISRDAIEQVIGVPVTGLDDGAGQRRVRAPGTLSSHYAPRADVRIVDKVALAGLAEKLEAQGERVAVLHDGPTPEARAHALYASLRAFDDEGYDVVLVATETSPGIGVALADRLKRAAAARDD